MESTRLTFFQRMFVCTWLCALLGANVAHAQRAAPNANSASVATGTGFFITADGYALTCFHVVLGAQEVVLRTVKGETLTAKVIAVDKSNDLALLKAELKAPVKPLPVADSTQAKRGAAVVVMGFPNVSLQGAEPKVTDGIINSFSGANNDPRVFQLSAPVQQGNSGGPLVTMDGNVVGVIAAKLDAARVAQQTGDIPQNVNYAIKSQHALAMFEKLAANVPDLAAKLVAPNKEVRSLVSDVVPALEEAIVLVLAGPGVTQATTQAAAPVPPPPTPTPAPSTESNRRKVELAREYQQHQATLNRLSFDEIALMQRGQLLGMMLRFDNSPIADDRRTQLAQIQQRLDDIGTRKAELTRHMNTLAAEHRNLP